MLAAIDVVLKKLKDNENSFGGAMITANGDCCNLSVFTGCTFFEACTSYSPLTTISSRPTKKEIPDVLKISYKIRLCELIPSNQHDNLYFFDHIPVEKTITINTTTTPKKINLKLELQFESLEERLRNILFTKKDETINNSNLIDVIIPIKHPLYYVFCQLITEIQLLSASMRIAALSPIRKVRLLSVSSHYVHITVKLYVKMKFFL